MVEQLLRRLVGVHVGLAEGVQDVGVGVAADDLLDRLDGGLDRRGGGGRAGPRPVGAASPATAAASHARRERGDRPNARWDGGAGGGGGARDRRRNRIKRREALGFGGVGLGFGLGAVVGAGQARWVRGFPREGTGKKNYRLEIERVARLARVVAAVNEFYGRGGSTVSVCANAGWWGHRCLNDGYTPT